MRNKFVYVLNHLKSFKAVPKINPRAHSPQQNKKAVLTTAAYFTEIIITLRLPSFTKKDVSGI